MFTVEQLGPLPLYHVTTPDSQLLALGFMRMQEYYESPVFRGTIFSVDEYVAWYTKQHHGFTYATDWRGFNVPSEAVQTVLWHFADHSAEEEHLFDTLRRHGVFERERFYLVGSNGSTWEHLYHEVCHALYYLVPQYRMAAQSVLQKYNLDPFRAHLRTCGYGDNVLDDEIQAYSMAHMLDGTPRTREFRLFRRELKRTLSPYLAEYLTAAR